MKRKALFLDRDGVINIDHGYVYRCEDFEFMDGIFDLCKSAQNNGLEIIIITNQAGIARGFYTEHDFEVLSKWVVDVFKRKEIFIADIFCCPYHPLHGIGHYKKDAECRKPNPGMILQAASKHDLNLSCSFLIGDKVSDIEAGLAAGVGNSLLLSSSGDYNHLNVPSIKTLSEAIPIIEQKLLQMDRDSFGLSANR
uniref:D,D-heptose 1,7-bisphosphate phosphatase n=1 Tax=Candidatus Kentrum sp. SD TaxID=2126332 RepID=A0A451BMQ0_9GAMM|nr:MAG: D-glycero-D-manno-heptose 1,7-bisphosphate phosphatase [Candidatus Kentron sp. SD]